MKAGLQYAGKKGWIGITKDKAILRKKEERKAIVDYDMRLIVLVNVGSSPTELLTAMVDSVWDRIPGWVNDHEPPWVVRVYRDTHHNIKDELLVGDDLLRRLRIP